MRILFWSAFAAFLVDQASKYVVIHLWELWRVREIDVLPPVLNFRYGENRGINFGLGDGVSSWVLIVLALVICIGILIWVTRARLNRLAMACAGLLVGGALANVVDRLIYGYVLDFLNNSCCGFNNPFVYNLADVFIFAGAIGLIFLAEDQKKASKKALPKDRSRASKKHK
ncbi:signal peptidase II [Sulfitobacter sp. F26204]|uniref:signal peptidase II n=1 Tax=Sulfitobacter sp. F26204 TaxID=2996014 RepID=UPI00225E6961|nr:signal peptidase II [Sulfitobacter sp. F26204]MCX7557965.1 signal peptidase II [Sulfitobacter sp. F26204]